MKRAIDLVISAIGLICLSPLFMIIAIIILATSPGGVFFRGVRIGKNGKPFKIFKFRSMVINAEGNGKWNVGNTDDRVTPVGRVLRNTKIDEVPQLINVFMGDMSLVGPRPELPYYTEMYSEHERRILDSKPGITDWASIVNFDQYRCFTEADDPDDAYLKHIRPLKLELQLYYRNNHSLLTDMKIVYWTTIIILFRTKKIPKEIAPIVARYYSADELLKS